MSAADPHRNPARGWAILWALFALAGAGIWLVMVNGADSVRAWRSLLFNFLFFTSLAGGLVVWPPLVRSCNGRWHAGIEKLAMSGTAFAAPSVLALLLLWVGSPRWAPWPGAHYHQGVWLNNAFLFGRDLAALLGFWVLAAYYLRKRRRGGGERCGIMLVLAYCLVFSLLGFDLVMALDPGFHSNLAGGYFFISGLYLAMAFWALLASLQADAEPDQLHDLGKLMVGFSLMTTYLMYAHLLPFWYENLPKEIRFLVPRMHNRNWSTVSYLLLCLVYFGPLVLLLTEKAKRNRWSLGAISLLVLCGMWLERWWLVAPTFDPLVRLGASELSLALAFAGLLGLGMAVTRRHLPAGPAAEENKP